MAQKRKNGSLAELAKNEAAPRIGALALILVCALLIISAALNLYSIINTKQCEPEASPSKVSAQVPNPPTIADLDGTKTLVYELYISEDPFLELARIDVLGGGANGTVLKTLEGNELNLSSAKTLPAKKDRVVFFWVPLQLGKIPSTIIHKVYFNDNGSVKIIEGGSASVLNNPLVVIGPPLKGTNWLAGNGPSNHNPHRTMIFLLQNTTYLSQRYAIDWMQYGENDKFYRTNGTFNEDYYNYGQDILAVADGTVIDTKDGVPDNTPGRLPKMTISWAGGNYAVLDIGNGNYAYYAHMIPGSLEVKIGDKVKKGDTIGKLGDSGNSDAPHLHFHIMNGKDPLFSQGLPYAFEPYGLEGTDRDWEKNLGFDMKSWNGKFGTPINMSMTMPIDGDVVDFLN